MFLSVCKKKNLTLNLVRELNCSTLVLYGIHKKATARRVLTSSIGTVHVCTLRLQQASHANKSKVKRLASDTIRSLFDAPLYSSSLASTRSAEESHPFGISTPDRSSAVTKTVPCAAGWFASFSPVSSQLPRPASSAQCRDTCVTVTCSYSPVQ